MALFFYEQWTCSLKKCHGASFGNGLKEEVEKHVFFFLWILKLSVLWKVWLFKEWKIKDMGELRQWQRQRGKRHWGKMRAALASRLTARASGCSWLARWLKQQRGPPRPSPYSSCPSEAARHREQCGDASGTQWAVWIGRYYSSGTGLPVCHGFADLLWQEITWHRQRASGITMILFYFVFTLFSFFFISVSQWTKIQQKKRKKPISFWYRDIPVFPSFRLSVFQWFIGNDVILQF